MKSIRITFCLLVLALLMGISAYAAPLQENMAARIEITVDGNVHPTPPGESVYIIDGRTYVSLKYVSSALNVDAGWHGGRMAAFLGSVPNWTAVDQDPAANENPQPIRFYYEGAKLELPQGLQIFVENNLPYVPLRYLAEKLGREVNWTPGPDRSVITITAGE